MSDSFSCLVDNHKLRVDLSSDLSLCLIRLTARQLNLYLFIMQVKLKFAHSQRRQAKAMPRIAHSEMPN